MQKNIRQLAGGVLGASIALAFALGAGTAAAQTPVKLRFSTPCPRPTRSTRPRWNSASA